MKSILLTLLLLLTFSSQALEIPNGYIRVAHQYGIPSKVFFAMALQESGKKWTDGRFLPWPWTLNVRINGKNYSKRYKTLAGACVALRSYVKSGYSTDIGLIQIHWQSHRSRLNSTADPCVLLKPVNNLRMAAVIYREQYTRSKTDVWKAVGWYHSPFNEKRAEKYRQLVKKHYRRLT